MTQLITSVEFSLNCSAGFVVMFTFTKCLSLRGHAEGFWLPALPSVFASPFFHIYLFSLAMPCRPVLAVLSHFFVVRCSRGKMENLFSFFPDPVVRNIFIAPVLSCPRLQGEKVERSHDRRLTHLLCFHV